MTPLRRRLFGVIPLWLVLTFAIAVTAVAAFLALASLSFNGSSLPAPGIIVSLPWTCELSSGSFGSCSVSGASSVSPGFTFSGYDDDSVFTVSGMLQSSASAPMTITCDTSALLAADHVSAVTDLESPTACGTSLGTGEDAIFTWTVALGDAVPDDSFTADAGITVTFENAP